MPVFFETDTETAMQGTTELFTPNLCACQQQAPTEKKSNPPSGNLDGRSVHNTLPYITNFANSREKFVFYTVTCI